MSLSLHQKIKKLTNFDSQCQRKLSILNKIPSHSIYRSNLLFAFMENDKYKQEPNLLDFKEPYYLNFVKSVQKTIIIKEQTIKKKIQKGKVLIIVINTNIKINVNLIFNLNNYQKNIKYVIEGKKGIQVEKYEKDDIKIIIQANSLISFASVRISLDLFQNQFQSKKLIYTISPSKQKQQIEQYIKLNRGKSCQILKKRSLYRKKSLEKNRMMSAETLRISQSKQIYRPISTSHCKRQIKQIHDFQSQKKKYLNHMKKMSPQKHEYFKQKHHFYKNLKQQHIKTLVSWIYLSEFIQGSRKLILKKYKQKVHKTKIRLLCLKFCSIMKSKLRFKITQKARYRMAIKQSIALMGEIFYKSQLPKAQSVLNNIFINIQTNAVANKILEKSQIYLQKSLIIQRYYRKKKLNLQNDRKLPNVKQQKKN